MAQYGAAMGLGECRPHRIAQLLKAGRRLGCAEEVELLVRKVDRRFNECSQLHQQVAVSLHGSGEFARKRPASTPHCRRRRTVDEIGDRLGLRQIDAIVEKCAQREFTGLRRARPELADPLEHHARDDDASVALKLEDIFTGVRVRGLEAQRETIVDGGSGRVRESGAGRRSRCRYMTQQPVRDVGRQRPGDTYDRNAASSGRSGDGRNRVAGSRKVHRPAEPSGQR